MAIRNPVAASTQPKRSVLIETEASVFQYCLKKTGKNPATTVVKKTLFAQSYMHQETIFLFMIYDDLILGCRP